MKKVENKKVAYAEHDNGMLYQVLPKIDICKRTCNGIKKGYCYGFTFRANPLTKEGCPSNKYRRLYPHSLGRLYCNVAGQWRFLAKERIPQIETVEIKNEKNRT